MLFAIGMYVAGSLDGLKVGEIKDGRSGSRHDGTLEIAMLLTFVAAGMLTVGVFVALLIRSKATRNLAASKEAALELIRADRVPPSLSIAIIMGAAIVEGPGLLGGIAYFLGAPAYALALPIIAALVIAWMIPSRHSLEESLL